MENKDERYLNVVLKNDNQDDEVVISFPKFFKKLKKYFLVWIVTVVVTVVLTLAGSAIFSADQHKNMTALVSFTFEGIEKGKDPAGNVFDVNTIKSPYVIETALTELKHSLEWVEPVREGISIEGLIPEDAIDRITTYKNVYQTATSGALSAAQAMLDVTYYPTQFKVSFNYAETEFDSSEAVEVFNTILECYRDYFFMTYGYNEALGSAVKALDYTTYDYAEAVDVFSTTLSTLRKYVNTLSSEDTTRFRSSETGYTFADLSEAIKAVQNMDLDLLSSFITVNNVTKDKDTLVFYYEYRIQNLNRERTIAIENLKTITESFNSYEKDTVMIFGNGTEGTDTVSNVASDKYDSLIQQKINAQNDLSTVTQQINFYNDRLKALKSAPAGSNAKKEKVEADLVLLNEKVNELIESVNKTADEYYSTVAFANAYNILVPASSLSVVRTFADIVMDSLLILFILEALIFVGYICFAFVKAIQDENKKCPALENAQDVSADDKDKSDEIKETKDSKNAKETKNQKK